MSDNISIHVPRAGYDTRRMIPRRLHTNFYPRTPCGVRHWEGDSYNYAVKFLSTYPVRGTTLSAISPSPTLRISIHVPRAGYDNFPLAQVRRNSHFYPRTPCGVRRPAGTAQTGADAISIHVPRAGYDFPPEALRSRPRNFYPRTPCGVRHIGFTLWDESTVFLSTYPVRGTTPQFLPSAQTRVISIHVPRAGYDR